MFRAAHPEVMWGLGLDAETAALIKQSAGSGFELRNLSPDAAAWVRGGEDGPKVAWIPQPVWEELPSFRREECRADGAVRRILILAPDAEPMEPELVLAEGFFTAVRAPLSRFAVRDALLRLRELDSLAADLRRRTEEVELERELLARKSRHLGFLNRVLSRASASLDPATILAKVRTDLEQLLPVDVLCAVFWSRGARGLEADLYLHCPMAPAENTAWQEILLAAAERLGGGSVSDFRHNVITQSRHLRSAPLPTSGRLLMLPLSAGGEGFGCLALMTRKGLCLAKDEVTALNASATHLGLALRNALLFSQMKNMADHDGLTQIPNRRCFDERLRQESLRHVRYGQPLSLILFDLDHFKRINDTLGHQAGDAVLRQMAALLMETLRGTDLPARYGGEEFAVILPHTGPEQAAQLAERIRVRVARHRFDCGCGGNPVSMTVSAGVATLGEGADGASLVAMADQALYQAKEAGRNQVLMAEAGATLAPSPRRKGGKQTPPPLAVQDSAELLRAAGGAQ